METNLVAGSTFAGEYKVLGRLSEGGMGAVFRVEQLSTARQRALKVMHPSLVADARLRARFLQEAKVGSRIDSPHVVDVVDAGVDAASGMPWIAMELLKGQTLASAIANKTVGDSCEILRQLGEGLAAAHDAGVVHRDVKPENVFLTTLGHDRVMVKILDLGIARVVAEARTQRTEAIGTPLWMAPEQTETGSAVTFATDVWSFGLLAYFVFTGRVFWRAADAPDGSMVAILREIALDPIPAASERARDQGVAGALPPGFDAWFSRCVARSSTARFQHAREATRALPELPGHSPVELRGHVVKGATHPMARPTEPMASATLPMQPVTQPMLPVAAPTHPASHPSRGSPAARMIGPIHVAVLVVAALVLGVLVWRARFAPAPTAPVQPSTTPTATSGSAAAPSAEPAENVGPGPSF